MRADLVFRSGARDGSYRPADLFAAAKAAFLGAKEKRQAAYMHFSALPHRNNSELSNTSNHTNYNEHKNDDGGGDDDDHHDNNDDNNDDENDGNRPTALNGTERHHAPVQHDLKEREVVVVANESGGSGSPGADGDGDDDDTHE